MEVEKTNYLSERIKWGKNSDAEYPYKSVHEGKNLKLRINDFPDEHFYSLLVDNQEIMTFDDWPHNWTRPEDQDALQKVTAGSSWEKTEFRRVSHASWGQYSMQSGHLYLSNPVSSGILNASDILRHLVMSIDPVSPGRSAEQLQNAGDDLRRAIVEPYETALDNLTIAFEEVYERYRNNVLSHSKVDRSLSRAPDTALISLRFEEIRDLGAKGREAKDKNIWDPDWESGVSNLIVAFDRLSDLRFELQIYCIAYDAMLEEGISLDRLHEKIREDILQDLTKESKPWTTLGTLVGASGFLLAGFLLAVPRLANEIRGLFNSLLNFVR